MSPRGWRARLGDIAEAGEMIAAELVGVDEPAFLANRTKVHAVLYLLVVIGEAAAHVPEEVVARYPQVDWAGARRMRNFVVHRYFGVRGGVVWATVVDDVPKLVEATRVVLALEQAQDP